MAVRSCAGNCERLISISAVAGGNPVALAEPDVWAVDYAECPSCGKTWCDRCQRKLGLDSCPDCGARLREHYTQSSPRDRLVDAIIARLRRYAATGDSAIVLSPDALRDVDDLWELQQDFDLVASYAAGMLHWCRHQARPEGRAGDDLAESLWLLGAVHEAAPRLIADPDERPELPTPILLMLEARHRR